VEDDKFDFNEVGGDWVGEHVKEENVGLQDKEHDEWLEKHGTDDVNEALSNIADELEKEDTLSEVDDTTEVVNDPLLSLAQDLEVNTYESVEELEQKIADKNASAEEEYEEFEEIVIPDADDLQGMTKAQIQKSADELGFEVDSKKTKQIMMVDFQRQADSLIAELTEQGAEISTE
jgi:hypothetical protein